MNLEKRIARVFNLTDENWLRHANPWSVGTRNAAKGEEIWNKKYVLSPEPTRE
jgi:hypothetical protein